MALHSIERLSEVMREGRSNSRLSQSFPAYTEVVRLWLA
jgi:hypothetical protein